MSPRRSPLLRSVAAALAVVVMAACGGAGGGQPVAGDNPYAGYPACETAPEARQPARRVPGLVLPGAATVQSADVNGPLTTVNAYVAATPLAVMEELSTRDDVEVLHAEDEIFEAELLVAADGRRSLVTAVAVCDKASRIVAVISPDGAGLPAPGGG